MKETQQPVLCSTRNCRTDDKDIALDLQTELKKVVVMTITLRIFHVSMREKAEHEKGKVQAAVDVTPSDASVRLTEGEKEARAKQEWARGSGMSE